MKVRMKFSKQILSILLCLAMLMSYVPMMAVAAEGDGDTDMIEATAMTAEELQIAVTERLNAGYTAITVNLAEDADATMFSAITAALAADGIAEGSIDLTISGAKTVPEEAFCGDQYIKDEYYQAGLALKSVSLPDATEIGRDAFYYCVNMTSVYIPEVVTIGRYAFSMCERLASISAPKCEILKDGAFSCCTALSSVYMPVAKIIGEELGENGGGPFCWCDNLTEISLPEATTIGELAFAVCENLKTVYCPKVTEITGQHAFKNSEKLEKITLGALTSVNNSGSYGTFYDVPTGNVELILACDQKALSFDRNTKYWTATDEAFDFGNSNEFIGYTFKSITTAHTPEADDGDCTTPVKCSACGETVVEAKESHTTEKDENKATCQKQAVCDHCGTSYGVVLAHNYTYTADDETDTITESCD